MKTLGNIIWVIFGGFELALATLIAGIVMCATIVGIPVGVQLFKVALFTLWPFGKTVKNVSLKGYKKVINIIWACVLGWVYFFTLFSYRCYFLYNNYRYSIWKTIF